MFETTFTKDVANITSKIERDLIFDQVYEKFHGEFCKFCTDLTKNGIVKKLFQARTQEERKSIWEEFSLKNQHFSYKVQTWGKERAVYFNTHPIPLFLQDDVNDSFMEITLILKILADGGIHLSDEDMGGSKEFCRHFTEFLN